MSTECYVTILFIDPLLCLISETLSFFEPRLRRVMCQQRTEWYTELSHMSDLLHGFISKLFSKIWL